MAEKINATCSICGKGYYKCLTCQSEIRATPWKHHTDTSEHYKIFQVIHGYNTGVYTKAEAKEKLNTIDLSDLNDLRDNIKNIIKDIMKENKKTSKNIPVIKEQIEEPIVNECSDVQDKNCEHEHIEVESDKICSEEL